MFLHHQSEPEETQDDESFLQQQLTVHHWSIRSNPVFREAVILYMLPFLFHMWHHLKFNSFLSHGKEMVIKNIALVIKAGV